MSERAEIYEFLEAKERDHTAVVSWVHRGDYEESGLYARGDVVRRAGASWVAVSDCPGDCPVDGWQLVAEVGEKGEKGDRGEQGYTGKQGSPGPPGAVGAPGRSILWRGRFVPFTSYRRDDVVYFDQALWIALRETEQLPKADQVEWDLMIRFSASTLQNMMYMQAPYTHGMDVQRGAVVVDDGWLMHANRATNEPAAPQAYGPEEYLYGGAAPTDSATVKQVRFGNRYTLNEGGFITGYRVYTVTGQLYTVYSVRDPDGDNFISQWASFTADTTGWVDLGLQRMPLAAGTVFEVIAVVNEPDPTPTEFGDTWNYTTPNNPNNPGAGDITHSDKELGVMRVSYTSNGGNGGTGPTDFEAQLKALTPGDTITGAGVNWVIQSVAPDASDTFISFGVSPATQGGPDGVTDFKFGTVSPTPITYMEDVDWWINNPGTAVSKEGVFEADVSGLALNGNAYGTDLKVQRATVSEHWDFMAYSG